MIGEYSHESVQIASPGGMRVQVYRDIRDIDSREWNCLLQPDDLLMSHSFVRVCQEAQIEDASFWHLIVSNGEEIVGIATLHRMSVNLELLSDGLTREFIGMLKQRWPDVMRIPVLFCGLPVSCGEPCLRVSAAADFTKVCAAIVAVMEGIAAATSTPLLCLKEFDGCEISRMDCLVSHGFFRANSLPSCSLRLRWESFSTYVGSLRSNYRRQIQSSLDARQQAALRITHANPVALHAETIFRLYQQTVRHAQHRLETLNQKFFTLLGEFFGDRSSAILIERDGRMVATALMLSSPNVATFLFAGIDDDRAREWQIYENLVLEILARAIASGAGRLELGQTSYAMKSRTGAEEAPRYIYLRYRAPIRHLMLRGFSGYLFPKHEYPKRRVFADKQ